MRKENLGARIWNCADKMRGSIDANDYKDFLFGLIFYKFLSEHEVQKLEENYWEDEDIHNLTADNPEELSKAREVLKYVIPYENLFHTWIAKGRDFTIADVLKGIHLFEENIDSDYTRTYGGIFDTFQLAIQKLGTTPAEQTKLIRDLILLVDEIPTVMDDNGDTLGYIYEYLMKRFASGAGASAGEFYTPSPVSKLLSKIGAYEMRDRNTIDIYDPASGSGSLLLNIGYEFQKYSHDFNKVKYFAQEKMKSTYNLGRMNLIMRGVLPDNMECNNADTLEMDWPPKNKDTEEPLRVDIVAANPPYSLNWEPKGKENDARFAYGLAPQKAADYAFLQHGLYHLKDDGIMGVVLPHGVLFRGNSEGEIRKKLIENNLIDTVIGLPAQMFYGTGIPTIIMIFKRKKDNKNILFIDASQEFVRKGKKQNELSEGMVEKIFETYVSRKDVKNYAKLISQEEIIANDYNLNIPRYVSATTDSAVRKDLFGIIRGLVPGYLLDELDEYWNVFPSLKKDLYSETEYKGYYAIKNTNVSDVFNTNKDVVAYKEHIEEILHEAKDELVSLLIDNSLNARSDEIFGKLTSLIYEKLAETPLLEKYTMYDLLYSTFNQIKSDLDLIQEKGDLQEACLMPKFTEDAEPVKYNGSEVITGEIIPVELIWCKYLAKEKAECDAIISEDAEVKAAKKEYWEQVNEDVVKHLLELDILNEKKDNIKAKSLTKAKKEDLLSQEDLDAIAEWNKDIKNRESSVKKEKKKIDKFLDDSENRLASLTLEECKDLLEDKWIDHLVDEISKLSDITFNKAKKQIIDINKVYEESALDINNKIKETNKSLRDMIDNMVFAGDEVGTLETFKDYLSD